MKRHIDWKMAYWKTAVLLCALPLSNSYAVEHEVLQQDNAFSVEKLVVSVGDVVNFTNNDSTFHNVFSLSETKFFDLGSYPQGESKSVTFDSAGLVEVECAIHPGMQMVIEVQ